MRILTSYLFLLISFCGYSQASDREDFDIKWHVEQKTNDFNTVFAPLYYEKDTIRFQELLQLSKHNNYAIGEIIALNLLGTYYRDQAQYYKSVELHNEALNLAKDKKLTDGILYSNNMLGVVYRRMDDVQKGLKYHFKALEIAEQLEEKNDFTIRNTAIAVNGIGNSYLILQEYESAKNQFRRSFEIEKSINNHLGLAINYQNIGYSFEKLNQLDSAQLNYFQSLKENSFINNDIGKMICYNSIGRVFLLKENYKEALDFLDRAEVIAEETGDSFYTATIYYLKGLTLLKLDRKRDSKRYLSKSVELSTKHNLKSNLSETYNAFATYYERIGDYQEALKYARKSKEVEADYLNENNLRIKNNLEISYETELKANQILNLKKEKSQIIEEASKKQRTILFLILLLAVLALLGMLFYQRDKLRKEKQLLELEQKVLRAQMNPHFTFNALNSIKTYIISQDTEEAVKYLNKFAKLIRGVLYSSEKKVVSLEEELETVESYLSIERLRFNDPIEYQLDIKDIDPANVEIPPLLLQPFIENALWHGLAPKKGEKIIRLEIFKESKNTVCINIIDNGVGRKNSKSSDQEKGYKSLGVAISRKRLSNHFNIKNDDTTLMFTDLKDENNNATGTKVTICIPIRSHD